MILYMYPKLIFVLSEFEGCRFVFFSLHLILVIKNSFLTVTMKICSVKGMQDKTGSFWTSSAPVLDLVGPGDIINVHANLVGDVGWQPGGRRVGKQKNYPCPKLPVLQQLQCSVNQPSLSLQPLQFVQGETLQERTEHLKVINGKWQEINLETGLSIHFSKCNSNNKTRT